MAKWLYRNQRFVKALCTVSTVVAIAAVFGAWWWLPRPIPPETRRVRFSTVPEGCEIIAWGIDPETGEVDTTRRYADPQPRRTPHVQFDMIPGDYLIVAEHKDGRFHEVYRHVPEVDEIQDASFPQYRSQTDKAGTVSVAAITLPDWNATFGMGLIPESAGHHLPPASKTDVSSYWRIPAFYADLRERNADEISRALNPNNPNNPVSDNRLDFNRAVKIAERLGMRLPSSAELHYLCTEVCPSQGIKNHPEGQAINQPCPLPNQAAENPILMHGLHADPWEWTTTRPGGPCSGIKRLAGSSDPLLRMNRVIGAGFVNPPKPAAPRLTLQEEEIVPLGLMTAGQEHIAIRLVRSLKPRRTQDDFVRPAEQRTRPAAAGQ